MSPDSGRTVELRLRAAVESSPSAILMVDAEGRMVLVNREVERLFGRAREELLGQPVEMLIPERFRGAHPAHRAAFFADPRMRAMGAGRELYGLRKDGSEVPLEIGLTPVVTDEGLFVLSSMIDLSARRRAEQRFRIAVESSPHGMLMSDREGRIVLANRELERMFGYEPSELLGQPVGALVPVRLREAHSVHRAAYYEHPELRAMGARRELCGVRKDGTEIPVEIGLNPIETDEGLFVLAAVVDIRARKDAERERAQLEHQLRQSQKVEALGTLAGGIAHDFNNILGAIVGYAEMVDEALQHDARARADLQEVRKAAERGRQLVQRILSFSRRQEPVRRPLALAAVVDEASKLLRATLPASVAITVAEDADAPRILADATAVQQVLMNLAMNAAHSMPNGGKLEIAVAPFYARDSFVRAHPELHEGPFSLLTVRDEGQGMDAAVLERAFEPFFTTKEPGSGTGLGLSMVHAIMRDHGGLVELESAPGQGTLARCYFPALASEATEAPARALDAPRGRGEHVLFVDDEAVLAELARRRLESLGYRVTVTIDSPQALEQFRAHPREFDLVLTDYLMPGLNGLELARRMTALRADIPILMLTGYIGDMPVEVIRAAGVMELLSKPITTPELARALRRCLEPAGQT